MSTTSSRAQIPIPVAFAMLVVANQGLAGETALPQQIKYDLCMATEWTELPPSSDGAGDADIASMRSAVRVQRAVDPGTEEPYTQESPFGCELGDLRRYFRLEKRESLLGEPILVEFHVELDGPGSWSEKHGGRYRARGRDDNFLFLMRHEDGTWVDDPYAPASLYMGGGLTYHDVRRGKPVSIWLGLQEWCAIERPGVYDLYCLGASREHRILGARQAAAAGLAGRIPPGLAIHEKGGCLIDEATRRPSEAYDLNPVCRYLNQRPSPVLNHVPDDVADKAGAQWYVGEATDFAHIRITIRKGAQAELKAMVERWTGVAQTDPWRQLAGSRAVAARGAIALARQDDFVPLIGDWIGDPVRACQPLFTGLVFRGTPLAAKLLADSKDWRAVYALKYTPPTQRHEVVPRLIEALTHANSRARARTDSILFEWTGEQFGHTWQGFDSRRPTLEEGRAMQVLWRAWWERNGSAVDLKK